MLSNLARDHTAHMWSWDSNPDRTEPKPTHCAMPPRLVGAELGNGHHPELPIRSQNLHSLYVWDDHNPASSILGKLDENSCRLAAAAECPAFLEPYQAEFSSAGPSRGLLAAQHCCWAGTKLLGSGPKPGAHTLGLCDLELLKWPVSWHSKEMLRALVRHNTP